MATPEEDKAAREQQQQENQKRAERERQQRQEQQKSQSGSSADLKFSNDEDPRSEEEKREAIDEHNRVAEDMMREATDQAMQVSDEVRNYYSGPFHGGQEIMDTRGRPMVFGPSGNIQVNDPHIAVKRQLAEENRNMPRATDREEARAARANPNDDTARAEVIARR